MLKELFESSFFRTFKKQGEQLFLTESSHVGEFSLKDSLACHDCKDKCDEEEGRREQIRIKTRDVVFVMKLDQVFELCEENLGENCDFIIDDSRTIALIEMTCSNSDYIVGKRIKARRQLFNTLCILFTNPDLRFHIEKEQTKFVVFSWKNTGGGHITDSAEYTMGQFTAMTDEVYSPDNVSKFDFGFQYKEIRYPDILNWNTLCL